MLAASLPPVWYQKPPLPSQRRGRSRNVSAVALARQESEERRRQAEEDELRIQRRRQRRLERQRDSMSGPSPLSSSPRSLATIHNYVDESTISTSPIASQRSISPTPDSSTTTTTTSSSSSSYSADYYTRPPSPPRTLPDRIQVAYAHDDITTAKMLLLQLKYGVEITSPTDPLLDTIKDEDFDECFVPCGGLKLEEADARMVEEGKRRQKAMLEEHQRLERLRACERIWEKEKRKMREEKKRVMRKREEEARVAEAKLREEEARLVRPKPQRPQLTRTRVLDSDPGPSRRHEEDNSKFQYTFMQPTSVTPPRRTILSSPKKKEIMLPSSSLPGVTFKEVVSSMHGPLFPPDAAEETEKRRSGTHSLQSFSAGTYRSRAQTELLSSLLKVVEWDEDERRRSKGKAVEARFRVSKSQSTSCAACCAAPKSAASTVSSRSSTALSRTSSWLSFVSSPASTSTAATTPATSPIGSWLKSAAPPLTTTAIEKVSVAVKSSPLRHSCATSNRLTPVLLADCPLGLPDSETKFRSRVNELKTDSNGTLTFNARGRKTSSGLGKRMSLGVSSFVELAKGFQSAYMTAAMFSVTVSADGYGHQDESDSRTTSTSSSRSPQRSIQQFDSVARRLKPAGYRALKTDVSVFAAAPPEPLITSEEMIQCIPLISPFPPPAPTRSPSRSVITATLKFPPQPLLQGSPYRPRERPTQLVYRMRPVSNPVILRLRALQNVLSERGQAWEGRGREGGLSCGKERVLGVAFEGRGRSGLGSELRVAVC